MPPLLTIRPYFRYYNIFFYDYKDFYIFYIFSLLPQISFLQLLSFAYARGARIGVAIYALPELNLTIFVSL